MVGKNRRDNRSIEGSDRRGNSSKRSVGGGEDGESGVVLGDRSERRSVSGDSSDETRQVGSRRGLDCPDGNAEDLRDDVNVEVHVGGHRGRVDCFKGLNDAGSSVRSSENDGLGSSVG